MLEFRFSKVKVVSLARKFLTLSGPGSLVLLTAETEKGDDDGEKRHWSRLKLEMHTNPLHKRRIILCGAQQTMCQTAGKLTRLVFQCVSSKTSIVF